jgi:hypothetical protein
MVLQAWFPPAWSADAANVAVLDETRLVIVKRGSVEHLELSEGRSGRQRAEYTADARESFEQIGKKFGLGKRDMARINRLPPDTIVEKGDTVIVYKVVDHTRSERAEKQWKLMPKPAKKKPAPKAPPGKGRPAGKVSAADDADDAEAPKAEAPKTAAKGEAPKAAAKGEAPKAAAKGETPKIAEKPAAPKAEAPDAAAKVDDGEVEDDEAIAAGPGDDSGPATMPD